MEAKEFEKLNNIYNQFKTLIHKEQYMKIPFEKPMEKFHDVLKDHMVKDAVPITEEEEMNWLAAEKKLDLLIEKYSKLIGIPTAKPWFALRMISNLRSLYLEGQRTCWLYKEIMGME